MSATQSPPVDPQAAARWHAALPVQSPWLHEEVARRMQERLQWIVRAPAAWCDWDPLRGGMQGHGLVARQFAHAQCYVAETSSAQGAERVERELRRPWWSPARWAGAAPRFAVPPEGSMQMLWSNMGLHMAADPVRLIESWHRALATDGYLMFSCLGPDTLRELRAVYADAGWPAPAHEFTDMHDWGDLLVHSGFAEPVMDMERITLTFATPQRLIEELRGLGRNLSPARFPALRGRAWRRALLERLGTRLATAEHGGQLALSFEVLYGHAIKPAPRVRAASESAVSLQDMRAMLRRGPTS